MFTPGIFFSFCLNIFCSGSNSSSGSNRRSRKSNNSSHSTSSNIRSSKSSSSSHSNGNSKVVEGVVVKVEVVEGGGEVIVEGLVW